METFWLTWAILDCKYWFYNARILLLNFPYLWLTFEMTMCLVQGVLFSLMACFWTVKYLKLQQIPIRLQLCFSRLQLPFSLSTEAKLINLLMDSYLKQRLKLEKKPRFHFFNSFFFRKLVDLDKSPSRASDGRAAFQRVSKWTRKVNLFKKDYLFIPVNFRLENGNQAVWNALAFLFTRL